jgi:hypothetical protein
VASITNNHIIVCANIVCAGRRANVAILPQCGFLIGPQNRQIHPGQPPCGQGG